MNLVITIDGPAASGKSSVSRELAARLGWLWVSTGAFYRGLAYTADRLKVSFDDENALVALANDSRWRVELTAEKTKVWFGTEEVTDQVMSERVGNLASKVSQAPLVRKALLGAQRRCAEMGQGLVAEGRDCGTVVFPQAKLKVYLTAEAESRAQRRAQESGATAEELLKMQKKRDQQDSSRAAAPLSIPEGALVIDSSEMNLQQVVDTILLRAVDFAPPKRHKP